MSNASTLARVSPGRLKIVERAQHEPEGRLHSLAHRSDVPARRRAYDRACRADKGRGGSRGGGRGRRLFADMLLKGLIRCGFVRCPCRRSRLCPSAHGDGASTLHELVVAVARPRRSRTYEVSLTRGAKNLAAKATTMAPAKVPTPGAPLDDGPFSGPCRTSVWLGHGRASRMRARTILMYLLLSSVGAAACVPVMQPQDPTW